MIDAKLRVCKTGFMFSACHYLPDYKGACQHIHGHNYKVEVEVEYNPSHHHTIDEYRANMHMDNASGFIIDFSDIKKVVNKKIIEPYDHTDLNKLFVNPTAENMVTTMFYDLNEELRAHYPYVKLIRIRLYETDTSYAEMIMI